MTDTRHDEFVAAAAAYALGALDIDDRRQFEAHLATCAHCQADVAAYRRVTAALGTAIEPVTPSTTYLVPINQEISGSCARTWRICSASRIACMRRRSS